MSTGYKKVAHHYVAMNNYPNQKLPPYLILNYRATSKSEMFPKYATVLALKRKVGHEVN